MKGMVMHRQHSNLRSHRKNERRETMLFLKKTYKKILVAIVCIVSFIPNIPIFAQEPSDTNLALHKPVVASAAYPSMPASYLTDGNEDHRWSTESAPPQWAYVDLGESLQMDYFSMLWESDSVYAEEYTIYVSDDIENWGSPVISKTGNTKAKSEERLSTIASGRYVKLEVSKMKGYPSVSCRDFQIKYLGEEVPQDPIVNVALGKSAKASSIETEDLNANKAFDGDTTSKSSRWSSTVGDAPHWIYVDLGSKLKVQTLRLFWETRKATSYEVQVANSLSEPMSDTDWTTVKSFSKRPASKNEKIVLDTVVDARYVRLYINSTTPEDPDGGVTWNSISLYEIEIYGGQPKENISEVANRIEIIQPLKGDNLLQVNYPDSTEYDITYNGTDYKQVIDSDLTIYEPIIDTPVKVSFKLVDKETKDYIFKEIDIVIPGTYTKEENDNKAPTILPELREWKGKTGNFVPKESSQIIIADEKLREVADTFANDYKEITGKKLSVTVGSAASTGEFYFTLTNDVSKGLQEEGYLLTIDDAVIVEATTTTGAFWATRTILQSLKTTHDIPKGMTRDYPMYEVRGFILDVGRKTFSLEFLEQVMKEMSWYKLNDFQIHLNDNLIFLEHYSANGLNPWMLTLVLD